MHAIERRTPLLSHRPYLFILLGQLISELGAALGTMANSWLLYQATGSQVAVGEMWLLYFLPSLAVQLLAGPYLDHLDNKRVIVFSQWMRSAAFCFSFLFLTVHPEQLWPLYVASLLNGLIQPLYVPSCQSILPRIVPKEQLLQANSYLDSVLRVVMIMGPPLGGAIVATVGGAPVLAIIAVSYALSGTLLMLCPYTPPIHREAPQRWVVMFRAGLRVFAEKPVLIWLSMYAAVVQFAVGVTLVLNLPFVVDELLGTSLHVGIFLAGYPLGYLFGSLLVPHFLIHHKHMVMFGSLVIGGTAFLALGFVHSFSLAVAIEIFAGLAAPFFQIHCLSLYQLSVPQTLMGRVLSVRLLIIRVTMPLGVWLGGTIGETVGVRLLFMAIGTLVVVCALPGLFFSKIWQK
ncbi:MFS transporter [Brevibacillus choshinensis]|uniref:MFS transporter n=1 Tax=Brevibacillus choshinensis TaxID=54911 RepID=UPI002E23260A|nr:MFS transporter [Brevibacillus choshinensis]